MPVDDRDALFRKPTTAARRGDASSFITGEHLSKPVDPHLHSASATLGPQPVSAPTRKEQPVTTSLRMYPSSQERLKLVAVQLRTTMTALVEEALSSKWEEWEARLRSRTTR